MLSMGSGGIVYVHRASTTYSQKYFLTIQSKRRTVHSVHGASQLRDRVAHVGEVLIVHHTYSRQPSGTHTSRVDALRNRAVFARTPTTSAV